MNTKARYWLDTGAWCVFIPGAVLALVFQVHNFRIIDIDTLSYINVAELYASLKIKLAINGYWSPLYSWLLALFIKAGVQPAFVCYSFNIIAATACFYLLQKMGRRYIDNLLLYGAFLVCAMLLVLCDAVNVLTPDLMAAALALAFFRGLWSDDYNRSRRRQVWTGIAAAILFFAKSYHFLFVHLLFFVLLAAALRLPAARRKERWLALCRSLLVFWSIALLWMVPLSLHEGKPVFSTAGPYSHYYMNPAQPGHLFTRAIVPPPFAEACTAWLNPSHQLDDYKWPVLANGKNMRYQAQIIRDNAGKWYWLLACKQQLNTVVFLVCGVLLALYHKKRPAGVYTPVKRWLLVIVLYPLGYLPFFLLRRYIYVDIYLFYLLLFYGMQETSRLMAPAMGRVFLLLAAAAICVQEIMPAWHTLENKTAEAARCRPLFERLPAWAFLHDKKIASADWPSYVLATQVCYRLHAKLYGLWSGPQQSAAQHYGVQYLLSATPRKESFFRLEDHLSLQPGELYLYSFVYSPALPSAQ